MGEPLFGANAENPDTYLCVLPLFHSFGQSVIQNGGFAYGGTVVMLPRFDAVAALQTMLKEKVTFFAGVPTMYWGLLGALDESGVDVKELAGNLRVAVAGGSALPVEVHKEFEKRFGVTILEGYGLSETSPVASFSKFGEDVRVGSIGTPIPGVEMKLLQPDSWDEVEDAPDAIGEIAIKGHNIMKGYYNRPEATDEVINDGWFRSGDLGRRDEDGWYYIVDRSKDMIIRGGYNVYPREIEEVLMTHPDVSLAAVIGVPHESHGEEIKAVVILNDGATVTEEELLAWGKEQMANYKYPRQIEFVDVAADDGHRQDPQARALLTMSIGRAVGLSIAGLMVLIGGVWTFQGLGYIEGSFMTDSDDLGGDRPDRRRTGRGARHRGRPAPQAVIARRRWPGAVVVRARLR